MIEQFMKEVSKRVKAAHARHSERQETHIEIRDEYKRFIKNPVAVRALNSQIYHNFWHAFKDN
jgi:hypothetical protein